MQLKEAPTHWFIGSNLKEVNSLIYQLQIEGCSNALIYQLQLEGCSNALVLLALTERILHHPAQVLTCLNTTLPP